MRGIKILSITVPIIILIAGIAIFYTNSPVSIEAEEGHAILRHNVTPFTVSPHIKKTAYAVTQINNGTGVLNLSITLKTYSMNAGILFVTVEFSAGYHMKDNVTPQKFLFETKELENSTSCYDFDMSWFYHTNSTELPNDKILPGAWAPYTAYIGIYPHASNFETGGMLLWDIFDYKNITVHTLKIEGVCIFSSQKIRATVDILLDTSQMEVMENEEAKGGDGLCDTGCDTFAHR